MHLAFMELFVLRLSGANVVKHIYQMDHHTREGRTAQAPSIPYSNEFCVEENRQTQFNTEGFHPNTQI